MSVTYFISRSVGMLLVVGLSFGCGSEQSDPDDATEPASSQGPRASAPPHTEGEAGSDTPSIPETEAEPAAETEPVPEPVAEPVSETDPETEPVPEAEPEAPVDDPYASDPEARITLNGGEIETCLTDFLAGGGVAAYAGFAGSSHGAYMIWKDAWEGSTMNLRVETWDAFGGVTEPGTYTLTANDTNYADCAVCILSEHEDGSIYWPQPGDTVEFTELITGDDGVGEIIEGTFRGTLSNGECSAAVEISFRGVARDMGYGPL